MNEIKIKDLEVLYDLPTISVDLEPLKLQVNEIKEQYDNWVVVEDDIPRAKQIRASLNDVVKKINRKRIDIAKEIAKPIKDFESELKGITEIIEELSSNINNQIAIFDEKQEDEKRDIILAYEHWASYMIFNPKWLNKTYKLEDIYEEIKTQKSVYANSKLLIETTCKNLDLKVEKYIEMLDEGTKIEVIVDFINNDFQLLKEHDKIVVTEENVTETTIETVVEKSQDTSEMKFDLRVYGTLTQLKALRKFIDENGMRYEKL